MAEERTGNSLATRLKYVGVILAAGFLVPLLLTQSDNILQRWVEWQAYSGLKAAVVAVKQYRDRHGYYPPPMPDVGEINCVLGTKLSNTEYLVLSCPNLYGFNSECEANTVFGWGLHATDHHRDFAPHCMSWIFGHPCPSCDRTGCYGHKKKEP